MSASVARELGVVESGQCDLSRYADASAVKLVECTQGHEIVRAHDSIDVARTQAMRSEECADGSHPGFTREVAGHHQARMDLQPTFTEGAFVAAQTRLGLLAALRARHEGDLAKAMVLDQMPHDPVHSRLVVHQHGGHARERDPDTDAGNREKTPYEVVQLG